jgi:hypothetical protein
MMTSFGSDEHEALESARRRVAGPALGLIIICSISLATLFLSFVFSLWLLVSGVAEELSQPAMMSKEAQIIIRLVWNVLMQAVNIVILIGAARMKGLRNHSHSTTACILSLIPCIGPCLVLGIPFGIWGLVVLKDPAVQAAFRQTAGPA